tara:strand:+ start:117 stop:1073 length:957 start_codon:yes stop_codon:yes gene_type:complete
MATADTIDIPQIMTQTAEKASKRQRELEEDEIVETKHQFTAIDRVRTLSSRMRELPTWFPTASDYSWTNVTRPGKSKRTLFVLTGSDGGQQFCTIGRVFGATLSEAALSAPSPFSDPSQDNTDLSLHLSMRPATVDGWDQYDEDVTGAIEQLKKLRDSAIRDAMVPTILGDDEKVIGLQGNKLSGYRKKKPDKLAESLEDSWGSTGTNEAGDIVRTKRRCYGVTDLSDHGVFMNKWLSVTDADGMPLNYIADETAVERNDVVLVWFRVLAQITAGNFHISLEPRNVMVLQKGAQDAGGAGSASFAASLMKAMNRGDQV